MDVPTSSDEEGSRAELPNGDPNPNAGKALVKLLHGYHGEERFHVDRNDKVGAISPGQRSVPRCDSNPFAFSQIADFVDVLKQTFQIPCMCP